MHLASSVDPQLADLSNKLIYSAMAVYLIAMFAYMFEWTFGAKGAVAVRSTEQAGLAGTVAAAEARAKGTKKVTVTVASAGGGTTTLTRTALVGRGRDGGDQWARRRGGRRPRRGRHQREGRPVRPDRGLAHRARRPAAHRRRPHPRPLGVPLAVGQHVRVLLRLRARHDAGLHRPAALEEAGPLARPAGHPGRRAHPRHRDRGAVHRVRAARPGPALVLAGDPRLHRDRLRRRLLRGVHHDPALPGQGLLRQADGGRPGQGPARHLAVDLAPASPAASTLDKLSYRINALVFPLWTFTIIAGAIWAEAAWGKYWEWDPKETWSFITWVAYACYLHARATAGWKDARPPTWPSAPSPAGCSTTTA